MIPKKSGALDLTQGNILKNLILMAVPIMATSFVQMTHNLVDMFWLSRLSSGAVAAGGGGGMYLWLSMALLLIGRMGAEIGVSQNIGKGDSATALNFAQNAFTLSIILGIAYGLFLAIGRVQLVGFFNIDDQYVVQLTQHYLLYVSVAIPFMYANSVVTGIFNGSGNTKIPFYINSAALLVNIAISPLFIFVFGLGVIGAAISTAIAQIIGFLIFICVLKKHKQRPFDKFKLLILPSKEYIGQIFRWGIPVALESAFFTFLSMISTRFVAEFGVGALAVQRVGSQIESLSWLIGGGFASAVTAFIGQNFGAGKFSRVRAGFKISVGVMTSWGLIVGLVMFVFAGQLMGIFLSDPHELQMGIEYMRILAFVQIFTCLEGVAAGCFRGRGLTIPPSISSITFNALRVPLAFILSRGPLGLTGIWIGLSIGMIFRGSCILIWYIINSRKTLKENRV
ncbi:MAG: MATE family efflux transporter [Defluviitaleaceae bacterium]|nr:MATE family efflux transporter [Defluviitaleaceae bacterium]